jgi:hypothetical protein
MNTPKFGSFSTDIRVEHTLFLNVLCETRIPKSFKRIIFHKPEKSFDVYLWSFFEYGSTVVRFNEIDIGCYLVDVSISPKSIEFITKKLIDTEKLDPYGIM